MPRKPTRRQAEGPAARLALVLRDALIDLWVRDNPYHTAACFAETRLAGSLGWERYARELLARGVSLEAPAAPGSEPEPRRRGKPPPPEPPGPALF